METTAMAPWYLLLALGAFHGLNPAMGWLFAVARGMQEGRRTQLWLAFLPLWTGHALAVGAAVAGVLALGDRLPIDLLRWVVAAILITLGGRRLFRHRHPRLGGMRVGMVRLAAWSFLLATAHGAGLMVTPILLGTDAFVDHAAHAHSTNVRGFDAAEAVVAATTIHTAGYLLVSALLAAVVYEKLGLRLLRTRWFNLDLLWALALVATGALTLRA